MHIDPATMVEVRNIVRRVAAVKIPVVGLKSQQRLPGDRRSVHRGEGLDFDGHDLYEPGDDPRTIDWNAAALTGGQQMLVGLFKEETHIKSNILCDVSPSMSFGSTRTTKRVLAAELAACAVRSLSLTHDPVGLVTYSGWGVERRIRGGSSASMMLPVLAHILESQPIPRSDRHSGLAKAVALLPRSPSIVFLLSDFINVTESDWEALKRAGRRHSIFAMFVHDLRERELPPPGWLPYMYTVQDAEGKASDIWVTKSTAIAFREKFKARETQLLERLKECRAAAIAISTEQGDAAIPDVLRFLNRPRS